MLLTVHDETTASHAPLSSACMLQMTPLQQSTFTGDPHSDCSRGDPQSDCSSSDSSNEIDSSREGELDGRARVGSQEEEQMRASSSGGGDSDEVVELKRQLAANQDQLSEQPVRAPCSLGTTPCRKPGGLGAQTPTGRRRPPKRLNANF